MKLKLPLVLLFAASGALAANTASRVVHAGEGVDFVIPADSPVSYQKSGEFSTVYYSGQFQLSGNFDYGYVTDNPEDDATYGDLFLTFTISDADAKRLPYWSRDGAIRDIYIRNQDEFVKAILSPDQLAKLKRRDLKHTSGFARIIVRNLETTIDCDVQTTSVEFVSLDRVQDQKVASILRDNPGC